jgi:hypothetical protein
VSKRDRKAATSGNQAAGYLFLIQELKIRRFRSIACNN